MGCARSQSPRDLLVRLCAVIPLPYVNQVATSVCWAVPAAHRTEVVPQNEPPQGAFKPPPAARDQLDRRPSNPSSDKLTEQVELSKCVLRFNTAPFRTLPHGGCKFLPISASALRSHARWAARDRAAV